MLHNRLEALNKELDEIALQKRLDIEAEHLKRIKCTKYIRFYVSFNGSCVKINTRVLNEIGNEEKSSLWDLVKRINICFNMKFKSVESDTGILEKDDVNALIDNSLIGEPMIFEWTKASKTDGFIVPLNLTCKTIQLIVKLSNKRNVYKLNTNLSLLLDKYTDTKNNIIKDLYKYINVNRLNNYSTSNVECDPQLYKIFGLKSFNFNNISSLLDPLLEPISCCVIDLENGKDSIWDIELEADDLAQMPVLYPSIIQSLEKKIEDTRGLIKKTQDKIELLDEFIENPSLFINRRIAIDSEAMGVKTAYFDDLNVQNGLFELIRHKD